MLSERARIESRRVFDAEPADTIGRFTYLRLALAPLITALLTFASLYDEARWRTILLGALFASSLILPGRELWSMREGHPKKPRRWIPAFFGIFAFQSVGLVATGGLHSPFLPVMIVLGIVGGAMLTGPEAWLLPTLQVAVIVVLASLQASPTFIDLRPAFWRGETSAHHNTVQVASTAAAFVLMLLFSARAGRILRQSYERVLGTVLAARDDALAEHRAHAREMVALSSEIAHELKNPLATIKALAALMARMPSDAKNAERLQVLREEVERMQATLEEFGAFSRPLVPLSLEVLHLSEILREVANLHEGMAKDARVALELRPAPADDDEVRCDHGKVRQILVNLVQNGLQASTPGSKLRLEVVPVDGGLVAVRVVDEGAGLDPAVAERVFDPGVTTKATGSGIGLGVSLGLARQHGGTLSLVNRSDRSGCVAELRLPRSGPRAVEPADEGGRGSAPERSAPEKTGAPRTGPTMSMDEHA